MPTPLRAPRTGLLTAAIVKDDEAGVRWGAGTTWQAEMPPQDYNQYDTAGMGSVSHGARALRCVGMDAATVASEPEITVADSFSVFAYDYCSAMVNQRDRQGRARRLLEATQSQDIAFEFWTGTIMQAEGLDGPYLTDTPAIWPMPPLMSAFDGTAPAFVTNCCVNAPALGIMDGYLTRVLANGRGMLHMTPEMFAVIVANSDFARYENGLWLSPNGHILVADAGYTGRYSVLELPQYEWIIATPMVEIVLGRVEVNEVDAGTFDHNLNDIVIYAQRDVLIEWEPSVAHGGFCFDNLTFDIFD